jgi:transmembrane sensor
MEARPQDGEEAASEQAMEWFVRLQDDPEDVALRRRFEAWLAEDPAHAAAWSTTVWTSSLAESLLPFDARDWAVDGAVPDRSRLRAQVPSASPRRERRGWQALLMPSPHRGMRWLWSVGTIAFACAVLVLAVPAVLVRVQADYVTGTAEARDIALEDGTTVSLAPGSALAVAFGPSDRGVTLLAGEAFFAVTPDAARPFRVTARSVRTTVIGTQFDIRLDPQAVEVAVNHGRVQVESAGTANLLSAGDALRISSDGAAARSGVAADGIAGWRRGLLVLEDRTLGDAATELERYLPGRIIISDRALARRPVTGVFDLRDPERGLQGMAAVLDAQVQQFTPWLFVVSRRR